MGTFLDSSSRTAVPEAVTKADLVVGIPSYHEADSIGHVVDQVGLGLQEYYPDLRSVIVNVDNASADDTRGAFLKADSHGVPRVYLSTPDGVAGKGRNFHNLFTYVNEVSPQAVAVVDADLVSITPEWMPRLLEPVLYGYDYVAPLYVRHPYDGTITNLICYPLIYALCGLPVRQPIGGDFAFAPWLADLWLEGEWRKSTCEYGIDITMTMKALFSGAKLAQAPLGAKIHKPSAPKLGPMFLQVVDSLFGLLNANRGSWLDNGNLGTVDVFGEVPAVEPQEMTFDHEAMLENARAEYVENSTTLAGLLRPATFAGVSHAFAGEPERLDPDLWLRCVYESLAAYTHGQAGPAVTTLKPLYLGRVVSFVLATTGEHHTVSERAVLDQAARFREQREYLIEAVAPLS